MATKSASLRIIVDTYADIGASPECAFDDTLALSGFTAKVHQDVVLPNGAVDDATIVTWSNDLIALVVVSDTPFSARLAAGETQMTNQRVFVAWADDEIDEVLAAGALVLSGNGSNDSNLRVLKIEKP